MTHEDSVPIESIGTRNFRVGRYGTRPVESPRVTGVSGEDRGERLGPEICRTGEEEKGIQQVL